MVLDHCGSGDFQLVLQHSMNFSNFLETLAMARMHVVQNLFDVPLHQAKGVFVPSAAAGPERSG
jgi:hypothetical protein